MKSQLMKMEVDRIGKAMEMRDRFINRLNNVHKWGYCVEKDNKLYLVHECIDRIEDYIVRHSSLLCSLAVESVVRFEGIIG